METALPSENSRSSELEVLANEKPTQLMAQLRAVWPQVQRALDAGHTLRLIHKRLNLAGLPITYKRLSVYRGRIQRGKKAPSATAPQTGPASGPPGRTPAAFDPLANLRAQEKKRMLWEYPSGPPDESKLF